MRQIFEVGHLLFVLYPLRDQVWIFAQETHIACLTFDQTYAVLKQAREESP